VTIITSATLNFLCIDIDLGLIFLNFVSKDTAGKHQEQSSKHGKYNIKSLYTIFHTVHRIAFRNSSLPLFEKTLSNYNFRLIWFRRMVASKTLSAPSVIRIVQIDSIAFEEFWGSEQHLCELIISSNRLGVPNSA